MKNLYIFLLYLIGCAISFGASAQGCVAVKNMSSCSMEFDESSKGLQIAVNYRYFRSYKHFTGGHEDTHRVEENTEVINNDNSINLGLTYTFNNKFSASLIIPYLWIDRSSLYEHLGNSATQNPNHLRFHTQSQGLGDIRAIGYYNALRGNDKVKLVLGLGVKAPTGNYRAKDDFHKKVGDAIVLQERVVDQSIQPGDGGFGLITEFDFSHKIAGKFHGYLNGMYLFNPRNTNGVERSPNLTQIFTTSDTFDIPLSNQFSVADQYMFRFGGRFITHHVQASIGGRVECIPSKDLIGDSDGFRRPGRIFSLEPSFFYTTGKHVMGFNFPIALDRVRTRSQLDIARGNNPTTGAPYRGDAAFADWLLSLTYAYKL
jgi:hypothetical protein